jgi:hypothetical protein
LFLAQEDFGDDINFTIHDKNGNAKNLTGITPKLQVWSKGLASFIDADCAIVDATNGQCKYTVKETDFQKTGTFYAKVLLKTGTTRKESTERFLLVVQE